MKKVYKSPKIESVVIFANCALLQPSQPGDIQGNPTGGSSIGGGSSKSAASRLYV